MTQRRDPALLTRKHRTVGRIAAILEAAAAEPGGVRLSALAEMLDAPKSSVHGLLKGLVSVGYLAEVDGGYRPGPALHALLGVQESGSLAAAASGPMRSLLAEFDETVMLGHRMGDSVVYLTALESTQLVKYVARLNTRRPVLTTSMGKIYLADLPRADLDHYLQERVSSARRRRTIVAQLAEVAERGVAVSEGETVAGLTGIAAGIRERGELVACVSIAGPSDRLAPLLRRMAKSVPAAAERITEQLP